MCSERVRSSAVTHVKVETDKYGSIKDINENCLAEFRTHWECLENHNQQLWNCRTEERKLNKCVFTNLVYFEIPLFDISANENRNWKRRYQMRRRMRSRCIYGCATSSLLTDFCILHRADTCNQ
jgi:hypothetical protein